MLLVLERASQINARAVWIGLFFIFNMVLSVILGTWCKIGGEQQSTMVTVSSLLYFVGPAMGSSK